MNESAQQLYRYTWVIIATILSVNKIDMCADMCRIKPYEMNRNLTSLVNILLDLKVQSNLHSLSVVAAASKPFRNPETLSELKKRKTLCYQVKYFPISVCLSVRLSLDGRCSLLDGIRTLHRRRGSSVCTYGGIVFMPYHCISDP